jgi:hypothetical protein
MRYRFLALVLALPLLLTATVATAGTGCCADKACCDNCKDC